MKPAIYWYSLSIVILFLKMFALPYNWTYLAHVNLSFGFATLANYRLWSRNSLGRM
jgi:hypothetical protein